MNENGRMSVTMRYRAPLTPKGVLPSNREILRVSVVKVRRCARSIYTSLTPTLQHPNTSTLQTLSSPQTYAILDAELIIEKEEKILITGAVMPYTLLNV